MRSKWLIAVGMFVAVLFQVGCGTNSLTTPGQCPVCGTTVNGQYGIIDIIPVPEHNPTGVPGGPFNSFDISWVDTPSHRFFVSDRVGLSVVQIDTIQNQAIGIITGANGVAGAGDYPSFCPQIIPPIVTGMGNFTRFGCRTIPPGTTLPWSTYGIPGFGAGANFFGGFPGAQCCAARGQGINPIGGPTGEVMSPDATVLFVGNGSANVVAFDMTCAPSGQPCGPTNPPGVLATIMTGASPDYDGCLTGTLGPQTCLPGAIANPTGTAGCNLSETGRALSDPTCGDMRADEMSIGVVNGRTILTVDNGDPGLPFVTLIDVTNIISRTGTPQQQHCLPGVNQADPYYPAIPASNYPNGNFPVCILGQLYYDGSGINNINTPVDTGGAPCPDPSTTVPSGVSGNPAGGNNATCHHGPVLNPDGTYCASQTAPPATCFGAIAPAGLGGSVFNPNTGHFLTSNPNASPFSTAVGTIDEIDPRLGNPNGPAIVNSFPMPNCMPTSITQGPGDNFLVGCGDHDGEYFPPNEYVISGTTGQILATIDQVGGVDEIWYNPTDNRYYLAARDMPNGPKMGVIDAGTNLWLVNVPTGSNAHSISVDSSTNHIFVPLQAGAGCTTQSSNGCVAVYAQQ